MIIISEVEDDVFVSDLTILSFKTVRCFFIKQKTCSLFNTKESDVHLIKPNTKMIHLSKLKKGKIKVFVLFESKFMSKKSCHIQLLCVLDPP